MKHFPLLFFLILLLLAACRPCEKELIDLGPLSDELLSSIPYKSGEYVGFKHSNGHDIAFYVNRETHKELRCEDHRCCTEIMFEENITKLSPNYPIFSFQLKISNADSLYSPVSVSIGRFGFMIPDTPSELEPVDVVDSLMINGMTYEKVYMMKYYDYSYQDDLIYVDSLLYNTDFGILKVVMSNGENYMRNE